MKRILSMTMIATLVFNSGDVSAQETGPVNVSDGHENIAYIGTYTKKEGHVDGQANGIYVMKQHPENGDLEMIKTAAEVTNPSWVKASSDGHNLYAVSELTAKDAPSGYIYSYKIKPDLSLEEIGKISTEAYAPCHIAIDKTGKYVFVSNYLGGVMMMYKRKEDGSLEMKQKITLDPEKSHTHSVTIPSDNEHIYVADLGLDKIWIYDFDAEAGRLTPANQRFVKLKEGAGPRHLDFSKNEDFVYSINELNSSVTAYKVKEDGGLEIIQNISTLPDDFEGDNSGAELEVHPSGKFLYVSNRGQNSIATFSIDQETGKISPLAWNSTEGKTPRNFRISPDGKYLYAANQDSGSIARYEINKETGELKLLGEPQEVKSPVSIEFLSKM